MSKRLLSVPEAAEILDLTQRGLWAMVGRRDIETVKDVYKRQLQQEISREPVLLPSFSGLA